MADAQLIITEIQSNQNASNKGDYWELTNAGTSPVNIGNYRWTDFDVANSFNTGDWIEIPAGTTLAAGESVIFTHATESAFRDWWGASMPAATKVFPTPLGNPGLGSGDGIRLYNAGGTLVTQLSYAQNGFTRLDGSGSLGGHAGPSARPNGATSLNYTALVWVASTGTTSPRYTVADGTTQGTFKATGTSLDLGSPGYSGAGGSGPSFSLSVSVTPSTFSESAANPAATGTVTRNGDLSAALVVTLASSDPTEATVPATVTIPANQASATFAVNAVDDFFPDGTKSVTITASATDANAGTTTLSVEDDGDVVTTKLMLTEVLSNQSSTAAGAEDYWELTNFGASAVSLEGYSWHDSGRSAGLAAGWKLPAGASIAPGESVIFTVAAPAAFRAWWNIPGTVQVFQTAGAPGLGKGDGISFFDPQQNELFFFSYAGGGFLREDGNPSTAASEHTGIAGGGATETQALVWLPSSGTIAPRYTAATGSNFGSFQSATGADFGSPGVTEGHPAVSIDDVTIVEGNSGQSLAVFTVSRSETTTAFSVDYAVTGGTAAPGVDFETVSGTLTFTAGGSASQTILVPVYGDLAGEPDETVILTLSNLVQTAGTTVIAKGTGTLTITNDDPVSPTIVTPPTSPTVVSGNTATLTLAVSGNPMPVIQWYQGAAGDTSTPVGTNSPTFTTPNLTSTTSYWARITNSAGTVDTGTIVVTVGSAPSGIDLSNYVRVGRYDLPEPTRTAAPAGNLLCQEASAVTYNWDTDSLFVTGDGGRSITQVSKTGQLIDTMTLPAGSSPQGTMFYDPEGLTYIGNGEFVMSEERDRQLVKFTYAAGTTLTRAQTKTVKIGTFVDNTGTEGLSWDPQTGGFIVLKEISPIGIFQTNIDFDAGTATNGSPTTENSVNLFDPALMGFSDVADVFALSNLPFLDGQPQSSNLIVLSQENARIINIDRSGNIASSLQIVSDPGNPLNAANQQHEGITMDRDGIIYVVNENGGGDIDHPQLWVYAPSSVPNAAPTAVALQNAVTAIAENTNTFGRVKVADIVVTDDGLGTNVLAVTGPDAAAFEIVESSLYIKAGTVLDYETKTSYSITVTVDDVSLGATPDASVQFTLSVVDVVNEAAVPTLIISEVAPWSSGGTSFGADWFEVTNTGPAAVDITGFRVDDNSNSFANSLALVGVTSIAPGESVIFMEMAPANAAAKIQEFKTYWFGANPPAGLQIGTYSGSGIGLSGDGDAVNLFNAAGEKQAGVTFGVATTGLTFENGAGLDGVAVSALSRVNVYGAFVAANAPNEIGSPGTTGELFISEVAPWGSGNSPYAADWFEVTNAGARPVNISGWKVDDNSNLFANALALNGVSVIAPGESVIFIETANAAELSAMANAFRTTWFGASYPAGLQIGSYSGGGIGLSTGGDAVNLFNAAGNLVTGVAFGSAATGPYATFENHGRLGSRTYPLPIITSFSVAGKNGAFSAANDPAEIGSPGSTGGVRITEIAPWSSGNSPVGADWFELTNFSSTAIDVTGWKMDDSSESPVGAALMTGVGILAPGESAIFIETDNPASVVPMFRTTWFGANPPAGLQIGSYTGASVGLSAGGDAVNVFSSTHVKQASVSFGTASAGPLFVTFENAEGRNIAAVTRFSEPGVNGAFVAKGNPNEAGSPGIISGTGPLNLAKWLDAVGLASGDDTDSDGVSNLLEFAFGLNPRGADNLPTTADVQGGLMGARGMPAVYSQPTTDGRDFRVVFNRRQGSGLTYIPQFSADLVTWVDSNAPVTVIATADGFEAVTIPYPFFVNGRKAQFFRVTVTDAP